MKILVVVMCLFACTKPNPNRCCVDEADCAASGVPSGSTCSDGLVCRGNQCIDLPCATAAECDASAPYCTAGSCTEACVADEDCPGYAGRDSATFCIGGTCAECRTDNDCDDAMPVCRAGICAMCAEHSECASGACGANGTCADTADIAYVTMNGSSISDCTASDPCSTIQRALSIQPLRTHIVIGSGTYASLEAVSPSGARVLIGSGGSRPRLTRTTPGPVVQVLEPNTDVMLENLEIFGATTNASAEGYGIRCQGSGSSTVRLRDTLVRDNALGGVRSNACTVHAVRCVLASNRGYGAELIDSNAHIDQCQVTENAGGLNLDAGLFTVTNTLIARNHRDETIGFYGLDIYTSTNGSRVEFNTIVDNTNASTGLGGGFNCNLQGTTASFPNNIIARNSPFQATGTGCTYPGSIVQADLTGLGFKSPDAAPYDYHLTAGSSAIDQASASTLAHDFDGDARPQGAGRDVGADEYKP